MALLVFALLLVGVGMEFLRERPAATSSPPDTAARPAAVLREAITTPILRRPGVPVPLQPNGSFALRGRVDTLVSDDASPNSGIWSVESQTAATTVQRVFPRRAAPLRLWTPAGRPDAVVIAHWTRATGPSVFLIRPTRDV